MVSPHSRTTGHPNLIFCWLQLQGQRD
jgi:hypothetical protein